MRKKMEDKMRAEFEAVRERERILVETEREMAQKKRDDEAA